MLALIWINLKGECLFVVKFQLSYYQPVQLFIQDIWLFLYQMLFIHQQVNNPLRQYFPYSNRQYSIQRIRQQKAQIMQKVTILPLGAGCQVGRSCIILNVNNKKIMLDCGLMINKGGHDALPLFDKLKPQQLSLILITHAHLDHCGALPYFLANYNYKKKIYMTKPTKDIYHYLVRDTLKVRNEQALFTEQQIRDSMEQISTIDFGIQVQQEGIKITSYVAGHIVGAAMFIIEIDGVKILYTGDYSCEQDRYIMKAQIPQSNVDILIVESTFGIRVHENRAIREQMFQQQVRKIVKGGGKCLLPVFSAGRAQQLLFILDQYWQKKKSQLQNIQIYYTVSLIEKCRDIYETYIDMLSEKIKQRFYKEINNPFKYRYIHYLKSNERILAEESNPMVVMCTPGMLQSGQSRTLLERWCHDPRNGVIITGYCAQGSIANNLKKGDLIKSMEGDRPISVNLNVSQISFAAHADCQQTTEFIKKVKPAHVVLVHGSAKNAQLLRDYLLKAFEQIESVTCPQNEEQLPFEISITEKYLVAGSLKQKIEGMVERGRLGSKIQVNDISNSNIMEQSSSLQLQKVNSTGDKQKIKQTYQFNGYIIQNSQQKVLIQHDDKSKLFPHLQGLQIRQKLYINYLGSLTLAELLASKIFHHNKRVIKNGQQVLVIKDQIEVSIVEEGRKAMVEFLSTKRNDIIVDQFCYLLENVIYDPLGAQMQNEPIPQKHLLILKSIREQYPQSVLSDGVLVVKNKNNDLIATANLFSKTVDCRDEYLTMRIYGLIANYLQEVSY